MPGVLSPLPQLRSLKTLTLNSKVEFGGQPAEGPHRLVHAVELASLLGRLSHRRPHLEVAFGVVYV